jgi:exopolysaccharide biosynthesis protein
MGKITKQELNSGVLNEINELTAAAENANIDPYYDEITFEKFRDSTSSTDYHITYVPNKDKEGDLIPLKHGFQNDIIHSGMGETARSFANRHGASLATNISVFDMSTGMVRGVQIVDGVIYQDKGGTNNYTLGIKADNTLVTYPPSITAASIVADGCRNAATGFFPIILNGAAVDPAIYAASSSKDEPNPRNVIAQMPNKDLVFLTCEGRTSANAGMTYADLIRILLARGVQTAYNMDGGGSNQMVIRGVMINNPVDDSGKTERLAPDFIYSAKPAELTKKVKTISKDLGEVNKRMSDLAADLLAARDTMSLITGLLDKTETVTDLDALSVRGESNLYWCLAEAVGAPTTASSWGVLHIQPQVNAAVQIAFPFSHSLGTIMLRRTNTTDTTWGAWRAM